MDDFQWIDGAIAVESVLRARSRDVSNILIRQDRFDGHVARIQQLAIESGVNCSRVPAEALAGQHPNGDKSTVIARVGPKRVVGLDELIAGYKPVVVLLDGVEDPYNFGQAVRSLYAAGIDGLALRRRNWLLAAATVIRSSAGATEFMPMAVIEVGEALPQITKRGFPIAVATTEEAQPMSQVDLTGPLLLVIGGEKRGVARSLLQAAALRVRIPYGREFAPALGTAGAAAVLGFEIMRQRQSRS